LVFLFSSAIPAWADAPVIAGAADLKFALEEIAAAFKEDTGREVNLVLGSSGNLYRQIGQDAPFRMFLSADEGFVFKLADAGKTVDRGELYAIGRIVILVPHGSPLKADGKLERSGRGARGRQAREVRHREPGACAVRKALRGSAEACRAVGKIKDRLVLGENVSQAAQFATSGGTQGGIVAYSLALAPAVARLGSHALIPDTWHEPLRQRMVLLKGADETTRAFYRYMRRPAARAIMERYGFVLPGEQ